MLEGLHERKRLQLVLGLAAGILFGFFLHKGGVTRYDVIIGQLRLRDFTVLKVMLSAVVTGMVAVQALRGLGLIRPHPRTGSVGSSVIGGLIFGIGFGLLGYCPGTAAGAAGSGWLDALVGGVPGIVFGTALFAAAYPRLRGRALVWGDLGDHTWASVLKVRPWVAVGAAAAILIGLLAALEAAGL